MKYSYTLLKKFASPLPKKEELIELLSKKAIETEATANPDALDIKVPANRYSDASSYRGIAKIISAISDAKFIAEPIKKLTSKEKSDKVFSLSIKTKNCLAMRAAFIDKVHIASSPGWLKDALHRSQINSINNIVDITNYVMLETGQPLHAFDFDKVGGHQLIIRNAKAGEKITTLDNKELKLAPDITVIADTKDALDIAGLKGGKKAEITENTRRILLTAGTFDGPAVYKASRQLNLTTEASIRFSHHLVPELSEIALSRAIELINKIAGGKVGQIEAVGKLKTPERSVKFNIKEFNRLSSLDLSASVCLAILKKIGFKISGLVVAIPAWRPDVSQMADLTEEIVNAYGLEKLKPVAPTVAISQSNEDPILNFADRVKNILVQLGLSEVYSYSFVNQKIAETYAAPGEKPIELENPISSDLAYLRPSLAGNILEAAEKNLRFYNKVKIFEIGNAFSFVAGKAEQGPMLAIAIADKNKTAILELKGIVESALHNLLVPFESKEIKEKQYQLSFVHAETVLAIWAGKNPIGFIGLSKEGNMPLCEINLQMLYESSKEKRKFKALSKYPSVIRDASLLIDENAKIGELIKLAKNSGAEILSEVLLQDMYSGEKLAKNKKSVTLRFVFSSHTHTLTDGEANIELEKILASLKSKFTFEIR